MSKESNDKQLGFAPLGVSCPHCGSKNTSKTGVLSAGPNIIKFLIIGWLYLVVREAFNRRDLICSDCGKEGEYKSIASWVCLGLLAALISIILVMLVSER